MQPEEYIAFDAAGLADLVARREVSPGELLDTALAAIGQVNGELNAVISVFEAEARRAIEAGLPEGPFRGVPFLLKDISTHYAGQPTGAAWAPRLNRPAGYDSELVRRYKAAGLVIFGKTAVPELAVHWSSESAAHGQTHNPWRHGYNSGTSSSGSAVAVAAGIVPMAHGSDGGGSIRAPASCCGVFGLKPSRGRTPAAPEGDRWMGMLCEHALTWTVRDSAILLDATAGPAPGQFYNSPTGGDFAAACERSPGRLRIAYSTQAPYGGPTHPDCIAAVEGTVTLLRALGHDCRPADLPLPAEGWSHVRTLNDAELVAEMHIEEQRLGRPLVAEDFAPMVWDILEQARGTSATDYLVAVKGVHRVAAAVLSVFEDYDVYLSPTMARPPAPLATFPLNVSASQHYETYLGWMPYTHSFNVAGCPAMSIPLAQSADGLPIGLQFAARPADEGTLFSLAAQLEAARPWSSRRPPVSFH